MSLFKGTKFLCSALALTLLGTACGGGDGDDDGVEADAMVRIDAMPADDAEPPPDAMPPAVTFVISADTLAIDEGGTGTVTVALSRMPGGTVDVTVASSDDGAATGAPATLQFDDTNFDTAQTITVTGVQDDDVADESVTLTISATDIADGTVAVTVTDDDELNIVANPTSLTVVEEATATFAVTLSAEPAADVTVTVASSDEGAATAAPATLTFTPANWDTAQDVTVTGVADADTANESVTVTLSSTGLAPVTVAVTVTDNDTQNIIASPTTLTITEGGAAGTFTVQLQQMPAADRVVTITSGDTGAATTSPASLTFTPANYDTPQTVTVTPVDDADTVDESVAVSLTSPGLTAQTVTVTVTDDDTQTIVLSTATLTVAEGGTGTFTVNLSNNPLGDFQVTIASSDTGAATAGPTTLTFDATNYATPQTVTVTGVEDADLVNEAVTVTASGTGVADAPVMVAVTDNDTQAIVANPASVTVAEGGTTTFGVRLAFMPAANVTVAVASNDTMVATAAPASLTFTPANYATPQNVTVTGVDDADLVNESTTITLSSTGLTSVNVSVTVTDTDVQAIVVAPTNLALDEGGADGSFTVRLSQMPGADVTVTLNNPDTGAVTLSAATLTFTPANYATPQMVTVSPEDDDDVADETVLIGLTAAGIAPATVTVTVNDDDTQVLLVTPTTLNLTEGGASGTFTVALEHDPLGSVTVSVASQDTGAATVAPVTLTFTSGNYETPQTVTVTTVQDVDLVDETVTVNVSSAIAPTVPVTVNIDDDDVQDILLSATSLTVVEEVGPATFTARLAFQPASNVTVTVTSGSAAAAVAPGTLTFTPGNYATPQTVTVSGPADQDLNDHLGITITVTNGSITKFVTVDVLDNDTQRIIMNPNTMSIDEGTSDTIGVSLEFMPDANILVDLTSSDMARLTVAPVLMTFTPANYATAQDTTVTANEDIDTANEVRNITANGTPTDPTMDDPIATSTTVVTIIDNDVQQIVLTDSLVEVCEPDFSPGANCGGLPTGSTTVGVHLQFDPLSNTTVVITSGDPRVSVSPSSMTFMGSCTGAGCWDTDQTLTVTVNDDADLADDDIAVTLQSAITENRVLTVRSVDDDHQVILAVPNPLEVDEENDADLHVSLQHQPAGNVTVNLALANEDVASLGSATVTFTPANWDTPQQVNVSGDADQNLNDETTTIALSATVAGDLREDPADESVTVNVSDNDIQTILVSSGPTAGTCDSTPDCPAGFDCIDNGEAGGLCQFRFALQEGGPTNRFAMRLEFPPADSDVTETVTISPTGDLTTDIPSFVFDGSNWDDWQWVTVTATDEAPPLDSTHEVESIDLASNGFQAATNAIPTGIADDEATVIASADYGAMIDGSTDHTKRQNVRWGGWRMVVTGEDVGTGEAVVITDNKDLSDPQTGFAIGDSSSSEPVETAEFDPVDGEFGLFSSNGADAIVFSRASVDLADVGVTQATVRGSLAAEFWTALDTLTDPADPRYGVLYRNTGSSDGLYFLTVDPDTGTPSAQVQISSSGALPHEKPNLHRTASGWVAMYTVGVEVHCVTMNPSGGGVTNIILSGFPGDGELVSSVLVGGSLWAVYQHATGLFVVELDASDCSVLTPHRSIRAPGIYPYTPFIAYNGHEFVVAFDESGAPNQVGVITLDGGGVAVDEIVVGDGDRPSAEWLGDRWAIRYAGSVKVDVGSFQTECHNGVQDGAETGVDCGGPDCRACYTTNASGYVRNWLTMGTFTQSFCGIEPGDSCACESTIQPSPGDVTAGRTWTVWEDPDDHIDDHQVFCGGADCNQVLGYHHIYLHSAVSQPVQFRIGSDDGIRIWHDNALIFDGNFCRGAGPDQDIINVTLNAGDNRVLVKVGENFGGWGLFFRVTAPDGTPLQLPYSLGQALP